MIFEFLELLKNTGCTIRDQYHIYCPACGGTRALEALLQFHPLESLYYNPIVILLLAFIIFMAGLNLYEHFGPRKQRHYRARIIADCLILVIWFLFGIIRNYLLVFHGIDLLGDFI